jgi:hypothetical protein
MFQKFWIGRKVFIRKTSGDGLRLVKIHKINYYRRLIKVIWLDKDSIQMMERVVYFDEIIL